MRSAEHFALQRLRVVLRSPLMWKLELSLQELVQEQLVVQLGAGLTPMSLKEVKELELRLAEETK